MFAAADGPATSNDPAKTAFHHHWRNKAFEPAVVGLFFITCTTSTKIRLFAARAVPTDNSML